MVKMEDEEGNKDKEEEGKEEDKDEKEEEEQKGGRCNLPKRRKRTKKMWTRSKRHSKGKIFSLKTFTSRTFLPTFILFITMHCCQAHTSLLNFSWNLTNNKHAFQRCLFV